MPQESIEVTPEMLDAAGNALIAVDVINTIVSPSPDVRIIGLGLKAEAKPKHLIKQKLRDQALNLGFKKRIAPNKAPFNSYGQEVFTNGKKFITRDIDGHNGGVWKMFDRKGNRLGTFDDGLNKIGK